MVHIYNNYKYEPPKTYCYPKITKLFKEILITTGFILKLQSNRHDGFYAEWYHKYCFFGLHEVESVIQIDGFNNLRIEDQNEIVQTMRTKLLFD